MRKLLRITGWITGSVLLIVLCALIFIHTPYGKNFVRQQVLNFVRSKVSTEVQIGRIDYLLPVSVELNDVLVMDEANDTLLAARKLKVNLNLLTLLYGKLTVPGVTLQGVTAYVYRQAPDTAFNFTYLISAFSGSDTTVATQQKPESESSSPMRFDIGRLSLEDIHIRFDDYTGGTRPALDLDELLLSLDRTDITNLDFGIDELEVNGLATRFIQDTSWLPPLPDTSGPVNFGIAANQIILNNIAFSYQDNISQAQFDINLNYLLLQPRSIDIPGQRIDIKKLALDTTNITMLAGLATPGENQPGTLDTGTTTQDWHVTAGDIQLAAINFKMDDPAAPYQPHGMDYSHLDIRNLNLNAEALYYTTDSISGDIKHLSVQERSGLDLKELRTRFAYHARGAELNDLYLATSGTVLQDHLAISYPSLQALQTDPGSLTLNIDLKKSSVSFSDVLLFVPDLGEQDFFAQHHDEILQLDASVNGYMNDLSIVKFHLRGLERTEAILSGRLKGLPDAGKLSYNLDITRIQSSARDLTPLLPDSLRQQIRLPDAFGLSGQVHGTALDYNTELALMTTEGNVFVKGFLHMSPGENREEYDLQLKTDRLHLGRILRQDSLMGHVSADFSAKGKSFNPRTMESGLSGAVHSAQLKGYDYNNIRLGGRMTGVNVQFGIRSADPNVQLSLDASAGFNDSFPSVIADLAIDSIDLYALHLASNATKIRTRIHAGVPVLNPDYPEAAVSINNTILLIQNQRHEIDSMYIVSAPTPDSNQQITASLDMLYATVTGHIPLTQTGSAVQEHISRHYTPDSTDNINSADSARPPVQYDLQIAAHVVDRPLLRAVLPGLTKLDTIHLNAAMDERNIELEMTAPHIIYGASHITGVTVNIDGRDSAFTYDAGVARISQTNFELNNASVEGRVAQNEITTALHIRDTGETDQFRIAAVIRQQDSDQVISLQPDLLIHYKPWQVATPNQIVLGQEGFYVTGFEISNGNKYIRISSETPTYNAPLTASVNNLSIGEITRIVSKADTLLADGTLSATVNLRQIKPDMLLTASADLTQVSVLNTTIGDIRIEAAHRDANTLDAEMSIQGQGNDIHLAGQYYTQPVGGNNFDIDLDLNAINLQSMEGLAMNQIRNSSGFLRGKLNIKGTTQQPLVTGDIRTDQLATTISMLGMQYRLPDEQILFRNNDIRLDGFDILDSAGNKITIDGTVAMGDLTNMQLALRVRAKDFKALSSTVRDNKSFYGSVVVSTNLDIKGPASAPDIGGSIGIERGTAFTVALPESEVKIRESEGIVEFIDSRDTAVAHVLWPASDDTLSSALAFNPGGDININIAIDSAAEFRLIVDPGTGDHLRVRGQAALNAAITPGGELTLAGTYELRGGAYQLNYNMIRRRFDIVPGSSITFAGDPLDAHMDITAIYEANIAPYDLVEKQVPDPAQLNFYKQRLPFDVHLKMSGELLQPYISFDIDLPEGQNYRMAAEGVDLVQAKLSQLRTDTSELNKQVFAVLILNRFVGEDPFASEGADVSAVARQSASRFISEQLNRYASGLIEGVDLSFDLVSSEDYTTGERRERTDLSVAASKSLFDDRLTVTVGNDFNLEGSQSGSQENTSLIPGNLAADYRLTPDGRYMLRAYRRDQTEGVMQGFITETGFNFITTHEYNRFRNLFNRKRRQREWNNRNRSPEQNEAKRTGQ